LTLRCNAPPRRAARKRSICAILRRLPSLAR